MSGQSYRSSPNMSIKSNVTLNSFYNINSASTVLKPFQSSLPYRVIEALSSSSRSLQNLTARISESGWAWLVSGRRLFVWRYADHQQPESSGDSNSRGASTISGGWPAISANTSSGFSSKSKTGGVTTKCYELLLPPSDIAHRAELICVISSIGGQGGFLGGSKFPAALAVSPEGAIRYWANISQESNVHDSIVSAGGGSTTTDLHGQECLTLVDIAPVGAILGTTTGSLVHIAFTSGPLLTDSTGSGTPVSGALGGTPFTCRTLKAPTGLLSGIGRRVSSFIFGSLPVTASGTDASKQLVRIVRSSLPSTEDDDAVLLPLYVLVLTNSSLQKWIVEDNATEGLIAEIDLERHIKEAFISKLWNRSTTSHSQLTLQPMDIATVKPSSRFRSLASSSAEDEVLLLVVCTNSDSPGDRHLGLFTLSETALPSVSSVSGDSSFSGVLPSSSSSSSNIFKSFCVFSNIELDDDQNGMSVLAAASAASGNSSFNSSITTTTGNTTSNSSLLPQRRHILNILPSLNAASANVDDSCYIYNSSRIYRINHSEDLDTAENGRRQSAASAMLLEEIDFQQSADYLLGAVAPHWHHCPLLFTFKNGFLALQSSQPESVTTRQLSTVDREFVISNDTDKSAVLKRALHLFTKGEKTRAMLIVQELFPWIIGEARPPANSAELDDVVCSLSADILDQVPTTDPRWAHMISEESSLPLGTNSGDQQSSSTPASINYVIIANQLEDKLATHRALVELLQAAGAWGALRSLTTATRALLPSKLVLLEHAEKLVVALSLRRAHLKYGTVLEAAIGRVLTSRQRRKGSSAVFPDEDQSHLTAQDLFYREVSRIEELFWALVELEKEQTLLGGGQNNQQHSATALVLSVTELFVGAFAEVCTFRAAQGATYASAALATADYVPWASAEHVAGVREVLHAQFELLLKVAAVDRFVQHSFMPEAAEGEGTIGGGKYGLLAAKIVELADILLDSYASQLAAIDRGGGEIEDSEDTEEEETDSQATIISTEEKVVALRSAFARIRTACLAPLLRLKQYEKAASLAEKYEDFEVLIRICEELGNEEQLKAYAARFAAKGFSERLFEWYLREGKQGRMLSVGVGGGSRGVGAGDSGDQRLSEFLSKHESLNWLHQIHLGAYREASATLLKLANVEEALPGRKKTLLSLGKLALIASAGNNGSSQVDYSQIDDKLKLLTIQEGLSEAVLRRKGLTRETLKVLSSEQLVEVLTAEEAGGAGGWDLGPNEDLDNFVAALEVADLMAKQSPASVQVAAQLVLKIWRRAFMKDDWTSYNTDQFEAPIRQSFFYQLASIYFGNGPKNLPPMSSLALENFSAVTGNEKASFFLRATYELMATN